MPATQQMCDPLESSERPAFVRRGGLRRGKRVASGEWPAFPTKSELAQDARSPGPKLRRGKRVAAKAKIPESDTFGVYPRYVFAILLKTQEIR